MVMEFLASGSLQRHVAAKYRVSKASFGKSITQVCDALCHEFQHDAFPKLTKNDWLKVSNEFNAKWNFPNCLGAIDGKHIPIKCPQNAGSLFFNYQVNTTRYTYVNFY